MSDAARALRRVDETLYEIPADARPDMRVPARLFASAEIVEAVSADQSLEQLQNVATLPGIVEPALTMPDIHWGYGFPIGGVAAFDPDEGGVVSPGGVGFDINCGVRLLVSELGREELESRKKSLADALYRGIPSGMGVGRKDVSFGQRDLEEVLFGGVGPQV